MYGSAFRIFDLTQDRLVTQPNRDSATRPTHLNRYFLAT